MRSKLLVEVRRYLPEAKTIAKAGKVLVFQLTNISIKNHNSHPFRDLQLLYLPENMIKSTGLPGHAPPEFQHVFMKVRMIEVDDDDDDDVDVDDNDDDDDDDEGDEEGDDDSLLALGVFLLQLLQHVHLQLGGLPVLVHVLDDLQRQHLVPEQIVIE